jgi:YidC/Oxa1 family membrane protein insertase
MHANNAQKDMVDIQPRMKEIQETYKDNPEKLAEETMKLFK